MLTQWAAQWGVPAAALADLQVRMGMIGLTPPAEPGRSEAAVQSRVRLAASKAGKRLFRNNSGAGYDEAGNFMRWGLGNDSMALNKVLKSSDLVGVEPRIIQPADVGHLFGQFVSYEVKHADWKYTGTEREVAQAAWLTLINSLGGKAKFITDEGQL